MARRTCERAPTTGADRGLEEIRVWVSALLEDHGSIASVDLDPEADALRLTVDLDGRAGALAFLSLRSWPDVEPRDDLTEAVREALRRGNGDIDYEFFLSGYAEECEMNRPDPTVGRK